MHTLARSSRMWWKLSKFVRIRSSKCASTAAVRSSKLL